MRALDLFSGIGGFALGLERASVETAAFCEISPKCRALLNHHWPEVPCYDDVETLTGERLAADGVDFDLLCGGFPCQDLSYAGRGAGLDGARSGLWFQISRILRERRDLGRPVRIVVLENVSALLARGLGVVLGDLASLGYDAEWDCIPASAVGAPHRRDRIWIVAYARGLEHEGFGDAFRRALAQELSRAIASSDVGNSGRPTRQRNAGAVPGTQEAIRREDREKHGHLPLGPKHAGPGTRTGQWSAEPDVGRVAHGVPARVDRLHGLGNAVVPQIPEAIGRAILTARMIPANENIAKTKDAAA